MSEPTQALNLNWRHKTHVFGDITAILTWTLHDKSPALVLIPTHTRLTHERITPCVVPLAMAHMWAPETGSGAHAITTSRIFAAALGFSPENPRTLFRITDIIIDLLGDLIRTPPFPAEFERRLHIGEATMTDRNTGHANTVEIIVNV